MSATVHNLHGPADLSRDLDGVVARLRGVRQGSNGNFYALCPLHEDRSPSMSVALGADGRVVAYCHRCQAGLDAPRRHVWFADLLATISGNRPERAEQWAAYQAKPRTFDADWRLVRSFVYVVNDHPAFKHDRYDVVDRASGDVTKSFVWRRNTATAGRHPVWVAGLDSADPPLYRGWDIVPGRAVVLVEGERDADTLAEQGFAAVSAPHGAGTPLTAEHIAEIAQASDVLVVADNDDAGRAHAVAVALQLRAAGVDVSAHVVVAPHKDVTDAGGLLVDDLEIPDDAPNPLREAFPAIDWHAVWDTEHTEDWIVEPLVAAGRSVAVYSPPKVGKSILMLEVAAAIACGRDVLGVQAARRRVLYVDFENTVSGDILPRLKDMGYERGDLADLVYLSFPSFAAFDSPAGGSQLLDVVAEYDCQVVVIDTMSRTVAGEENANDTWNNWYRLTGFPLKATGVAVVRLDHTGKDESRGMRGGSAKYGDVDAVWRLSKVTEGVFHLGLEARRMPINETSLTLERLTGPLRHEVRADGKAAELAARKSQAEKWLDAVGYPKDGTVRGVWRELKEQAERDGMRKNDLEVAQSKRQTNIAAFLEDE